MNTIRVLFYAFIDSEKQYPLLAAFASGLYPLLYYYNANFTLINSWSQFAFFISLFLILPMVVFYVAYVVINKINGLKKYGSHLLAILNFSWLGFLILLSTEGLKLKLLAVILVIAFILGFILHNHLKKAVVLQLLLAAFVAVKLIPDAHRHLTYTDDWAKQPDAIEEAVFKKKPNIYVIQPDGYANFSELRKAPYNFNNNEFEQFLSTSGFKLYEGFRSNYYSTLSSNSSMFSMKHHYYNTPKKGANEVYNSRKTIVGSNPVLTVLKNNGYKTFLMLHKSYLLVNRAKLGYDYCNIGHSELSFMARGFGVVKDVESELPSVIKNNATTTNFFFIEQMSPSHISTYKSDSKGKDEEREGYLKSLEKANVWLKSIVRTIEDNDKNAIVIIAADHGGFVGLDYTFQSKTKQEDSSLVTSVFTTLFAVKWPDNKAPDYDDRLKTNVNIFRVLFSYLSEDESYLNALQEDKSYLVIEKGSPFGVYESIDENGTVVFKKLSK
ncbi:hypothetical protein ES677_03815 [Bizionia gelidisalsuginis]|uniref:Sulfatase N-terminal domain-containing protein n=2 Tax=Bizionia TaxID=283785 RepID=A0A8H2LEH1_9FLAO|nr:MULTISPECIES: sulfatase-like hydrolase/transferase [Bizionia]TYB74513.1 hypothetical protein ES676_07535 [Bizionia saleffrena]TYC16305.1 hypothetical protein ES677_03815 [Bizionia gelidisalsuginis]